MWAGGSGNRTSDLVTAGRAALPPESQLPLNKSPRDSLEVELSLLSSRFSWISSSPLISVRRNKDTAPCEICRNSVVF